MMRTISLIGQFLEAHLELQRKNRQKGIALLRSALTTAREIRHEDFGCLPMEVVASLSAHALVNDIEVEFVRNMILKNRIPSHDNLHLAEWPVPVRIYTLGRFSLTVDNLPVQSTGKAQKKPIELLKLVIAMGGRDVCIQRIADQLWPDVEGDAAYQNFTVTLFRLRKLTGNSAIILQDRRLTLDSQKVWVDAWEFDRLLGQIENSDYGADMEYALLRECLDKIMSLYQGPFLGQGDIPVWALSQRERLHSRFIRILLGAGRTLEHLNKCDEAITFYQKGIELDELAEEFHQRLISCLAELGRQAEAISAYKRCQRILEKVLHIEPTQETQAIYAGLQMKSDAVSGLRSAS